MKSLSSVLLILFIIDFIADVIVAQTGNESARYFTKGLLMPLLFAFFIVEIKRFGRGNNLKYIKFIGLALAFSFAGDMFLVSDNGWNFILGIASFLIAHIFYILFFYRIKSFTKKNGFFLLTTGFIIAVYVALMNYLFRPLVSEQQLTIPVMAYSVVLGTMLFTAFNVSNSTLQPKTFAYYIITGAVIFAASDSMIAFNKFYLTTPLHGFYIMLTYCLAQCLIVTGAIQFIKKEVALS
ncbi:MAG TPA: lysoplasmalogenase [Parafilimonas sp.]|nr:lysoplasmalogenase [Parafilimonas sp.]